jgi:DNA topoisomerase-2
MTRYLFPEADNAILNYLNDDGTMVEPDFYVPIIPFALVNGISGIGTGFSCSIPSYNPRDLVAYLTKKLKSQDSAMDFVPYYEGFKGTVRKIAEQKFLIKGLYTKMGDDKIHITELPVGSWTMPYVTFLETLMDGTTQDKTGKKIPPSIKDFTSTSTEVSVDFVVVFPKGKIQELESVVDANGVNGLEKMLKLTTTVSTTNMHMFNADCRLKKYETVADIIDDFYGVRLTTYRKRKAAQIATMEQDLVRLSNRARYILETLSGAIDLRRKTSEQVQALLTQMKFAVVEGDFKYLIKMPMDSVTEENVAKILKEKSDLEKELEVLRETSVETIWLKELDAFSGQYELYKIRREALQNASSSSETKKKMVIKVPKKI